MKEKMMLISDNKNIYAIPENLLQQCVLAGKELEMAREALLEDADVEGQTSVIDGPCLKKDVFGRCAYKITQGNNTEFEICSIDLKEF